MNCSRRIRAAMYRSMSRSVVHGLRVGEPGVVPDLVSHASPRSWQLRSDSGYPIRFLPGADQYESVDALVTHAPSDEISCIGCRYSCQDPRRDVRIYVESRRTTALRDPLATTIGRGPAARQRCRTLAVDSGQAVHSPPRFWKELSRKRCTRTWTSLSRFWTLVTPR